MAGPSGIALSAGRGWASRSTSTATPTRSRLLRIRAGRLMEDGTAERTPAAPSRIRYGSPAVYSQAWKNASRSRPEAFSARAVKSSVVADESL